jgi:hypothetical protein
MAKIALDVAQNRVSRPVIFSHTGAFSISMIEASEIEMGLSLALTLVSVIVVCLLGQLDEVEVKRTAELREIITALGTSIHQEALHKHPILYCFSSTCRSAERPTLRLLFLYMPLYTMDDCPTHS